MVQPAFSLWACIPGKTRSAGEAPPARPAFSSMAIGFYFSTACGVIQSNVSVMGKFYGERTPCAARSGAVQRPRPQPKPPRLFVSKAQRRTKRRGPPPASADSKPLVKPYPSSISVRFQPPAPDPGLYVLGNRTDTLSFPSSYRAATAPPIRSASVLAIDRPSPVELRAALTV